MGSEDAVKHVMEGLGMGLGKDFSAPHSLLSYRKKVVGDSVVASSGIAIEDGDVSFSKLRYA